MATQFNVAPWSMLTGKNMQTGYKPPAEAWFLGNVPYLSPGVNAPALQYSAQQAGNQFTSAQMQSLAPWSDVLANQQRNEIGQVARTLNTPYAQQAIAAAQSGIGQATALGATANQIAGLGAFAGSAARNAYGQSAPNALENQIFGAGMGAMRVRADQVGGPSNIREIAGAGAQFIGGPQAAMARGVANVQAGQVGAGGLGDTLMAQAMRRAQSDGRLSAEANRDAVQAARAGMAARGMATGNAGLAAEMLNRDRFARSRQAEDLAFAQGVQGQDVERQFANVANRMRADQGNQEVSARMALADQAAQNQMGLAGYQGSIEQIQAQAARNQQANMANQSRDQALAGMSMDAQMANQAANMNQLAQNRGFMMDAATAYTQNPMQRAQLASQFMGLGGSLLGQSGALRSNAADAGFRGATTLADIDPTNRALMPALNLRQSAQGMGLDSIGQSYGSMLDLYANTGSFNVNRQDSLRNSWMNNATAVTTGQQAANSALQAANITAASNQAAASASRPRWYETALGAVGRIFSDERMKKDIKPVGSNGVLGLTTYEYRYKGDPKRAPKRIGYMAQEVAEVLPQAVEEVNYRGKKRLAIKPAVIGAALAEELAAQAA